MENDKNDSPLEQDRSGDVAAPLASRSPHWKMRRLTPDEHPQLWHLQVDQRNGYYITACGRKWGIAGSASKYHTPAGACSQCLEVIQ